jgi:hypothetical protein
VQVQADEQDDGDRRHARAEQPDEHEPQRARHVLAAVVLAAVVGIAEAGPAGGAFPAQRDRQQHAEHDLEDQPDRYALASQRPVPLRRRDHAAQPRHRQEDQQRQREQTGELLPGCHRGGFLSVPQLLGVLSGHHTPRRWRSP